jgi:hypothetical protein
MKLRIRGSSLRLRLGRTEVERLSDGARVEETIAFGTAPAQRLVYAAVATSEATAIGARFAANEITVTIPTGIALAWAKGDDVGLESEQPVGDGTMLSILVEKDFACLKPRPHDDDADAYPNPT